MASSQGFLDHVLDLLSGIERLTVRKMMGRMTCARCGRRVPVRLGVMPRRCACGASMWRNRCGVPN